MAHLQALGLAHLKVLPDPVGIATEGALWGAITAHGFLCDAVVVSAACPTEAFPASIMSRMTVFFPTFMSRVTERIDSQAYRSVQMGLTPWSLPPLS